MRRPTPAEVRRQVDSDLARLRSRPGAGGGPAGQDDPVAAALEHLETLQRKGRARIAQNADLLESILREEGRQTSTVETRAGPPARPLRGSCPS